MKEYEGQIVKVEGLEKTIVGIYTQQVYLEDKVMRGHFVFGTTEKKVYAVTTKIEIYDLDTLRKDKKIKMDNTKLTSSYSDLLRKVYKKNLKQIEKQKPLMVLKGKITAEDIEKMVVKFNTTTKSVKLIIKDDGKIVGAVEKVSDTYYALRGKYEFNLVSKKELISYLKTQKELYLLNISISEIDNDIEYYSKNRKEFMDNLKMLPRIEQAYNVPIMKIVKKSKPFRDLLSDARIDLSKNSYLRTFAPYLLEGEIFNPKNSFKEFIKESKNKIVLKVDNERGYYETGVVLLPKSSEYLGAVVSIAGTKSRIYAHTDSYINYIFFARKDILLVNPKNLKELTKSNKRLIENTFTLNTMNNLYKIIENKEKMDDIYLAYLKKLPKSFLNKLFQDSYNEVTENKQAQLLGEMSKNLNNLIKEVEDDEKLSKIEYKKENAKQYVEKKKVREEVQTGKLFTGTIKEVQEYMDNIISNSGEAYNTWQYTGNFRDGMDMQDVGDLYEGKVSDWFESDNIESLRFSYYPEEDRYHFYTVLPENDKYTVTLGVTKE